MDLLSVVTVVSNTFTKKRNDLPARYRFAVHRIDSDVDHWCDCICY